MYISITKAKSKIGRKWSSKRGVSAAFVNPVIKPAEPYTLDASFLGGDKCIHMEHPARVEGQKIIREPMPSYNLKVGISYRKDGKVKSRQKHLYTFSELDIIDGVMMLESIGDEHRYGGCINHNSLVKELKEGFPDADVDIVWKGILDRMKLIEDPIIDLFKQSDEYYWWGETLKLKQVIAVDLKGKKQLRQERERAAVACPKLTLSVEEALIIEKCYEVMSIRLNSDEEDTTVLNNLIDKLKNA